MSDEEDEVAVVIDNGGYTIKAGFAGDDTPQAIFPCIVGRTRQPPAYSGLYTDSYGVFYKGTIKTYVGNECQKRRALLRRTYPIKHGIIQSWDDMERIWRHTLYNELRVTPEEHPLMMTENCANSGREREKITQLSFEEFNIPLFYLSSQCLLSLYASGRTTGTVVISGYDLTTIAPFFEGYILKHAVKTFKYGGDHLTKYLIKLLSKKGYSFTTYGEQERVNEIKEKLCYVSLDFDKEIENENVSNSKKQYELPDGNVIDIDRERFKCSECLFKPDLFQLNDGNNNNNNNNNDNNGIHEILNDSILQCDISIHKYLYKNIVICGGNSMFNGFAKRLSMEINKLVNKDILVDGFLREYNDKLLYKDISNLMKKYTSSKPKIIDIGDSRKYSSWIGGSILSSLSTFEEMCIKKEEYNEFGPCIVHRKCL